MSIQLVTNILHPTLATETYLPITRPLEALLFSFCFSLCRKVFMLVTGFEFECLIDTLQIAIAVPFAKCRYRENKCTRIMMKSCSNNM